MSFIGPDINFHQLAASSTYASVTMANNINYSSENSALNNSSSASVKRMVNFSTKNFLANVYLAIPTNN